jgi:hypothetical protein
MVGSIICFVDIETDGPLIGVNAMRSFAAVAFDDAATEVGSYSCNLSPFEGAQVAVGAEHAVARFGAWSYLKLIEGLSHTFC